MHYRSWISIAILATVLPLVAACSVNSVGNVQLDNRSAGRTEISARDHATIPTPVSLVGVLALGHIDSILNNPMTTLVKGVSFVAQTAATSFSSPCCSSGCGSSPPSSSW